MLDIIFISYDEPTADVNWKSLKDRFPHAQRVHGVKGIANAHLAASKKANTRFFFVVDADADVLESFNFSYKPSEYDSEYVHIWEAFNPALGVSYGYGGVKLFNKSFFNNITSQLDFSTTLAKGIKLMPEIACVTRFNCDQVRAFRGAFRETVKLFITTQSNKPSNEIKEAQMRLDLWLNPAADCDYREYVLAGAKAGLKEAQARYHSDDMLFINDHDFIASLLIAAHPEIDFEVSPQPSKDNPMKSELFFTTRIASAFYDPYVLENVKMPELRDALSDGQLLSKNWIVEVLMKLLEDGKIQTSDRPLRIVILGGWIGTLALMMHSWELPVQITSVDMDGRANRVAEKLNYDFNFTTKTMDMYDVIYDEYDLIINTSSEHIPDIKKWRDQIPANKLILVQNNDFEDGEGHVSCVSNSHELRSMLRFSKVLYEGTRKFPQYNRFMLIGQT